MGAVRKLTGVEAQIQASRRNAAAIEEANLQNAQSAEREAAASAKAAADQQAMLASRAVAEAKAADVASAPLATAEVSLDASTESTAAVKGRRARFGIRASRTGVNV